MIKLVWYGHIMRRNEDYTAESMLHSGINALVEQPKKEMNGLCEE